MRHVRLSTLLNRGVSELRFVRSTRSLRTKFRREISNISRDAHRHGDPNLNRRVGNLTHYRILPNVLRQIENVVVLSYRHYVFSDMSHEHVALAESEEAFIRVTRIRKRCFTKSRGPGWLDAKLVCGGNQTRSVSINQ